MKAPNSGHKHNQKYFIDYENEHRQCSNCLEIKSFTEFSKQKTGYPRVMCKQCRSKISYRRELEKKLEMFPNDYYECPNEDCMYIWKKKAWHWRSGLVEERSNECKRCGGKAE